MGLDGFSMGNLGIHKELTSAQIANNAEVIALKGNQKSIKNIDQLSAKKKSSNKTFEEENEEPVYYFEPDEDDYKGKNHDSNKQNSYPRQYTVRLNTKTQLVELIDVESGTIIETITPSDLIKLVNKLSATSGILVNRKI